MEKRIFGKIMELTVVPGAWGPCGLRRETVKEKEVEQGGEEEEAKRKRSGRKEEGRKEIGRN